MQCEWSHPHLPHRSQRVLHRGHRQRIRVDSMQWASLALRQAGQVRRLLRCSPDVLLSSSLSPHRGCATASTVASRCICGSSGFASPPPPRFKAIYIYLFVLFSRTHLPSSSWLTFLVCSLPIHQHPPRRLSDAPNHQQGAGHVHHLRLHLLPKMSRHPLRPISAENRLSCVLTILKDHTPKEPVEHSSMLRH